MESDRLGSVSSISGTSLWIRPKSLQLRLTECQNWVWYLVPASWFGSEREDNWPPAHRSWIWSHRPAAPECQGWPCLWRTLITTCSSGSGRCESQGLETELRSPQASINSQTFPVPRRLPDLCQRTEWCPGCWGCNPCKTPSRPPSLGFSWHSQTFQSTVPSSAVSAVFSAPVRTNIRRVSFDLGGSNK